MTAHRPFSDVAGYTRHCLECVHAKHWEKRPVNGDRAMCDVIGAHVYKFDSPNNQCSHVGVECHYETGERRWPTMTSATERLRALLDDRGVEWTADDGECVKETCWPYMGELTASFAEYANGTTRFACDTWCFTPEQAIEATLGETPTPPPPTPPKQPPYDELIESLRRDWDIEASWDGLRRFWYIGLTDEGVRKRDKREATLGRGACEVEAENAKLRELVRFIMHQCNDGNPRCDECIGWNDGECVALQRMHDLGIGMDA